MPRSNPEVTRTCSPRAFSISRTFCPRTCRDSPYTWLGWRSSRASAIAARSSITLGRIRVGGKIGARITPISRPASRAWRRASIRASGGGTRGSIHLANSLFIVAIETWIRIWSANSDRKSRSLVTRKERVCTQRRTPAGSARSRIFRAAAARVGKYGSCVELIIASLPSHRSHGVRSIASSRFSGISM